MHLDDERIERLIDGELTATDMRAARTHLAECGSCRERMEARSEDASQVAALLTTLDRPAPAIAFADVEARARARRPSPWGRSAIGWAAAAVIAVAAAAAPGSPVPGWVGGAVRWVTGASRPGVAPAPMPEADGAGIAVDPGSSFVIEIVGSRDHSAAGMLIVRWTDDGQLTVRSSRPGATFTSSHARLTVSIDRDSVALDTAVPGSAPRVEIRADGRTLWLGERGRVTSAIPPDSDGSFRISLGAR